MGDYNRTIWKDHIKDQNGNVIQQGTPVSAKNLNNIENQIVSLSSKENVLAELVRESIPSGFTTLSDLDFTTMSTTPNTIKLLKDSVAYVNGYKVIIPAGTTITLNAPPTSGIREDLVFLEVWKQADSNGAEQLNWRIRVVDGVDFGYIDGMVTSTGTVGNCIGNNYNVTAQGANLSPISPNNTNINRSYFRKPFVNSPFVSDDVGMYVAGAGDTASKTTLGTTDGYCYAIPMFRVKRRNSDGYSVSNANGGNNFYYIKPTSNSITLQGGNSTQISVADTSILQAGDILYRADSLSILFKIISIDSSTLMTIKAMYDSTLTYTVSNTFNFFCKYTRPDGTYANIVNTRDIIDLRHQVSLTGFNYQALLEESFDKLLRGELQTNDKTKMLKTYHGLAKTPIDANHVFYASLDGTSTAEIGGAPNDSYGSGNSFVPAITGLGVICSNRARDYALVGQLTDSVTIDCIAPFNGSMPNGNHIIYSLLDSNGNELLRFSFKNGDNGTVSIINGLNQGWWSAAPIGKHYRLVINSTNISIYVDGKLKNTWAKSSSVFSTLNVASIVKVRIGSQYVYELNYISDFSISNIDRGSVFATLPQDFIDGYARIAPAFNTQRNVFSDALTSETPLAQVKCAAGNNKEITLGDSTDWIKDDGTKWNTGDRIKIKGLGGEIITGVIDSDTALAKSTTGQTFVGTGPYTINVDEVSKPIVGDNFTIVNATTGGVWTQGASIIIGTITAIDTTNKIITFNTNLSINNYVMQNGDLLCETTASSSAPTVKANLTGTAQAGAASTITLPSTFSATDDTYNGLAITITGGTGAGQVRTISDYVGSTKVATVNSAWATNPDSTSVFLITGVSIVGTWSGLGTNEATFTLSANSGLVAQDLWINYSLNEVPGQGGISEVLTATLAGESNGKKLVVNPSLHVRDDLAGKTNGNVAVNPNVFKVASASSLLSPTGAFTELGDSNLPKIMNLDGTVFSNSTNVNGQIAQDLISWNVIREVEDKYGPLPCPSDTASKVAWLKANVNKIICNWWGYGSGPSGNRATLVRYSFASGTWLTNSIGFSTTNNAPSVCSAIESMVSNTIDLNGFVHFLAYADASDGVTPSIIYTDYVNIEIILNTPIGFDVLCPENPRRDDGKGNMILIRKETKEIQSMFCRSNNDGIVTYGDYVPYQGMNTTGIYIKNILSMPKFIISRIGTGNGNNVPSCKIDMFPSYSYDYHLFTSDLGNVLNDTTSPRIKNIIEIPLASLRYNLFSTLGGSFIDYLFRHWDVSNFAMFNTSGLAYKGLLNGWGSYFPIDLSAFIPANWTNCYAILSVLVKCTDGTVRLLVIRGRLINKMFVLGKTNEGALDYMNSVNRPLIK